MMAVEIVVEIIDSRLDELYHLRRHASLYYCAQEVVLRYKTFTKGFTWFLMGRDEEPNHNFHSQRLS